MPRTGLLEEGEPGGPADNLSHLLSTAILYCCFFPSKYKRRAWGALLAGGAPASPPPASSPASPGPLSGSCAAAHMVACQIPSGSGGHVSGSWQLSQPRVTMETAANGRPAQSAGAEPSEAGAGGRGGAGPQRQKTEGGAGSLGRDPGRSGLVRSGPVRSALAALAMT